MLSTLNFLARKMQNTNDTFSKVKRTVEEWFNLLPLYVSFIDDESKKYNLSIFRHSDGQWVASYEDFDNGLIAYQTINDNLSKALESLYNYLIQQEDIVFASII